MSKPTYMELLDELEEAIAREKVLFEQLKEIACDPRTKYCEKAQKTVQKVVNMGNTFWE